VIRTLGAGGKSAPPYHLDRIYTLHYVTAATHLCLTGLIHPVQHDSKHQLLTDIRHRFHQPTIFLPHIILPFTRKMVQYSWAIMTAMLLVLGVIYPTQALWCRQVQFGFYFPTWTSTTIDDCFTTCATNSSDNYNWQVANPDDCEAADGLSGINVDASLRGGGSCGCTYEFVMWRVHNADQYRDRSRTSCANSDIANRIANNATPWYEETLKDSVHCAHQN
jgi:hypothetical protein